MNNSAFARSARATCCSASAPEIDEGQAGAFHWRRSPDSRRRSPSRCRRSSPAVTSGNTIFNEARVASTPPPKPSDDSQSGWACQYAVGIIDRQPRHARPRIVVRSAGEPDRGGVTDTIRSRRWLRYRAQRLLSAVPAQDETDRIRCSKSQAGDTGARAQCHDGVTGLPDQGCEGHRKNDQDLWRPGNTSVVVKPEGCAESADARPALAQIANRAKRHRRLSKGVKRFIAGRGNPIAKPVVLLSNAQHRVINGVLGVYGRTAMLPPANEIRCEMGDIPGSAHPRRRSQAQTTS